MTKEILIVGGVSIIGMRSLFARSSTMDVWFHVLPAVMSKLALGAGSMTIHDSNRNNSCLWGFEID